MPHAAPPTPLPRHRPNPHRGVAPALLAAVLGYLLLSAWMLAPAWERAFRSDGSPVAWLSSALLLTLSITALRLLGERALPRLLGAWLAVAFLALALDEQFMLHELWKFRCHEWTTACQHSTVRQAPMLAVAVVGLLTLAWLHRALLHPGTRALLWAGLTVGWSDRGLAGHRRRPVARSATAPALAARAAAAAGHAGRRAGSGGRGPGAGSAAAAAGPHRLTPPPHHTPPFQRTP